MVAVFHGEEGGGEPPRRARRMRVRSGIRHLFWRALVLSAA